jgi:hypothetical protein
MATIQIPPPNYADIVRDPASGFRIVYNRDQERG